MTFFKRAVAVALAIGSFALAAAAHAAYPERPITFVVPWGAGGGTDTTARYFATMLEKELGQPV
ncbi:MAG TPA: tripartite tricarboxylate transporter substrate binding protein, partial [Casimicrobiaceae bacterium]|nr:tripartite tricarboxylate transporter substrate binding protein [Casimicrobiaceae bacterium]